MVRSKLFTAFALTGMAALTSTASGDLVIDDFASPDGGQFAQDNQDNGIPTWDAVSGLPVLGGTREIYSDKTEGSGFDEGIRGEVNGSNTDGIYAYDQFTSTFAGRGRLIYDGTANKQLDQKGLAGGGFDLTAGGNSSFLLEGIAVTGSGLKLTVNVYDALTGGVFSSGARLLTDNFRGDVLFDYSTFSGIGGMAALSNVGAIEVIIDGREVAGSDMTIGRMASTGVGVPPTVPEPSSLILAGLASIGGLGFRWRRGKKNVAAA